MSTNATVILPAAHNDAMRFAAPIDLKNISEADARKLMSAEHKALGFRPPPGSLAAEAQAEAAKHPKTEVQLSVEELRKAALEDAERIKQLRLSESDEVNLNTVGQAEARKLMSEEHKALGYRPPPGSLAAQAQSAASKHPNGNADLHPDTHDLQRAALEDVAKLEASAAAAAAAIDLNAIGEAEARKLMSEEHKALGYRPPPGSLAAEAQSAAAKHPQSTAGVDAAILAKAALEDAKRIESQRRVSGGSSTSERMNANGRNGVHSSRGSSSSGSMSPKQKRSVSGGSIAHEEINPATITAAEAHQLQSEEQKTLGYRPPSDSLAAQVQSVIDKRDQEPVTKDLAASIQSQEQRALGHRPETGSIAAVAQSLADKNENDAGNRALGEAGM